MSVESNTTTLLRDVPEPYHQIFDLDITGDVLSENSKLEYKIRRAYASTIESGLKSTDEKTESICVDDDAQSSQDSQGSKASKSIKVVSLDDASSSIKAKGKQTSISIIEPTSHDHCPTFDVQNVQHYTVLDTTTFVCLIARCLGWNSKGTEIPLLKNIYPWNEKMDASLFSSVDNCFTYCYKKHIANVIHHGLIAEFELDDPQFATDDKLQQEIINAVMYSFSEYGNPNKKLHGAILKYKETINQKLLLEQSQLNTLISDPSTSKEDKEKIQKEFDNVTTLLKNIKIHQYERFAICKSGGEWYVLYLINVYKYHTPGDLKNIREQNKANEAKGIKIKKQRNESKYKDVLMMPLNMLLISISLTTTESNFTYVSKLDEANHEVKFLNALSALRLGFKYNQDPNINEYVQKISNFVASSDFEKFADDQCFTAIGVRKGFEYVLCRTSITTKKDSSSPKIVYPKKPRSESLIINHTRQALMNFGLEFAKDHPTLNINTNVSYQLLLLNVKKAMQQQTTNQQKISDKIFELVGKAIAQATLDNKRDSFFKTPLTVYNEKGKHYVLLGFQRFEVEITEGNKVKRIKQNSLFKSENTDTDNLPADTTNKTTPTNSPNNIFNNLTINNSQSLVLKIYNDKLSKSFSSDVDLSNSALNKAGFIIDCYMAMVKYLTSDSSNGKLYGTKLGTDINKYSSIANLKRAKSTRLGTHFNDFDALLKRNSCFINSQKDRDYFVAAFDILMKQEDLFNRAKNEPLGSIIRIIATKKIQV